jgi:hypothetical protein
VEGDRRDEAVTEMVVVSRRLYGPGHQLLVWREVADAWIAAGDAVEVDPPPEPIQEPPIASTLADEAWAVVDAKVEARAARKRATATN